MQVIRAKIERLLADAPAATLDCSQLFDAKRLLSAIADVATKHAGTASCAVAALSHATPAAAAAAVHTIIMSSNCLQPQHIPELVELLRKFPSLKQLDVSVNPDLWTLDLWTYNGAFQVAALIERFPALRRIGLSRNGITRAHLSALLPMLQSLTMLVEVDLSHNALDVEEVCRCFESLASIRSLAVVSFVRRMQSLAPQLRGFFARTAYQ